jgi:hypothetical protein
MNPSRHVVTVPKRRDIELEPHAAMVYANVAKQNCLLSSKKGGRLRSTPLSPNISSMLNPLVAITESPFSSKSSIPEHLVISLSYIVYNTEK